MLGYAGHFSVVRYHALDAARLKPSIVAGSVSLTGKSTVADK